MLGGLARREAARLLRGAWTAEAVARSRSLTTPAHNHSAGDGDNDSSTWRAKGSVYATQTLGLSDPLLYRQQCYVGGAWEDASDGSLLAVYNPATQALIGAVPNMAAREVDVAIAAAKAAQPAWAERTAGERSKVLKAWRDQMIKHHEDLAIIMTAENGKPLKESRGEISYATSFVEWFAEEAKRAYGDVIPSPRRHGRVVVLRQPVGVTAAITPWNFPSAMVTRKAAAALAAGCAMVIKPSEMTPLSALALADLAGRAGLPPGLLSIVTGDAAAVGGALTASPDVRKISFTGSTRVGKLLYAQSAPSVKRLSLELGGNAPFIVLDDADIPAAVACAVAAKFRNAGQTCVCPNRLLVMDSVHDAFVAQLAAAVAGLVVGDGLDGPTDVGPLINGAALAKVQSHVADAVAKGAVVRAGGRPHAAGGTFYEPTVLEGATREMLCSREETFGPVASVFRVSSEREAIAVANDTSAGLAAYVMTRSLGRAWRVSEALEYGMVGVNTGAISTEVAPFGGVKESGLGREGGREGMAEYLETKYINMVP